MAQLLFALLLVSSLGFESPSPFNPYYSIPYYYGNRDLEKASVSVIVDDSPSVFFWSSTFAFDDTQSDGDGDLIKTLWVVDPTLHTLYYISKTNNAMYKVAGKDGINGYRDGNLAKALFNEPSSLNVFYHDPVRVKQEDGLFPIYVYNTENIACMFVNY
jgi:hypothetical protein